MVLLSTAYGEDALVSWLRAGENVPASLTASWKPYEDGMASSLVA
jgi:hypothetical protein